MRNAYFDTRCLISVDVSVLSEMFGRISRGRVILAMYDPDSQYTPLFVNISAEHLRSGGDLLYLVSSRPPNEISQQFSELGLDIAEYEARDNDVLFRRIFRADGSKVIREISVP